MKNAIWFAASCLCLLGSLAVGGPGARAQTQQVLKENPGVDCMDYTLNVLTLVDNDHKIYWKQFDCIRVHVRNNPFIFKYDLSFDEQLIKEDDPLSTFGGKFGLNVSGVSSAPGSPSPDTTSGDKKNNAAAQKPTTDQAYETFAQKEVAASKPTSEALRSLRQQVVQDVFDSKAAFEEGDYLKQEQKLADAKTKLTESPKPSSSSDKAAVDSLKGDVNQLDKSITTPPPTGSQVGDWNQRVKALATEADAIHQALGAKEATYRTFSEGMPGRLVTLTDTSVDLDKEPDTIWKRAQGIREAAAAKLRDLTDGDPDESGYGSKMDEERMIEFAQLAAPVHAELSDKLLSNDRDVQRLLDELHKAGRSVVVDACSYKAQIENDFATIRTRIIDPLDAVLNDPVSFGYTVPAKKREGPWSDPESVIMKVKRDSASPFAATSPGGKTPKNTASSFDCSSDTSDLFEYGDSYARFKDFFTDKPVKQYKNPAGANNGMNTLPNVYMRNQNKPQPTSPQGGEPSAQSGAGNTPPKPAPSATASTVVLTQPWFFGKARLVLTGGLSTAFLTKTEFQRSSAITGTGSSATSSTVIGLKNDTRFRFTPMLYGHTLLYSKRHDSDAWYATLGVTANSDNKGTDPEFLVGFSRSWAQQKFFTTVGAYIGERQKLDGGLYVGETIPSTLTGDLPVTKSYHIGWAFGLSYRFASTKDPQNSQPKTPAKPSN